MLIHNEYLNTSQNKKKLWYLTKLQTDFGTRYYRRLMENKRIVFSDQQLTVWEETEMVDITYATDPLLFRHDFAEVMIKLSSYCVLTKFIGIVRNTVIYSFNSSNSSLYRVTYVFDSMLTQSFAESQLWCSGCLIDNDLVHYFDFAMNLIVCVCVCWDLVLFLALIVLLQSIKVYGLVWFDSTS